MCVLVLAELAGSNVLCRGWIRFASRWHIILMTNTSINHWLSVICRSLLLRMLLTPYSNFCNTTKNGCYIFRCFMSLNALHWLCSNCCSIVNEIKLMVKELGSFSHFELFFRRMAFSREWLFWVQFHFFPSFSFFCILKNENETICKIYFVLLPSFSGELLNRIITAHRMVHQSWVVIKDKAYDQFHQSSIVFAFVRDSSWHLNCKCFQPG